MKMINVILIVLLLPVFSFPVKREYQEPAIEKILVINSFDAQSIHARKNKKLLFAELADSLRHMLYSELDTKIPAERIVIPGLINYNGNDSIYFELIKKHSATKAIVIRNVNAYFSQTGVEVTRGSDGKKEREASYDINSDIDYIVYDESKKIKEFHTQVFEFFTTRSVVSGLLAAGPDIVGKRKHAFKIIQKNAQQFVRELKAELESN